MEAGIERVIGVEMRESVGIRGGVDNARESHQDQQGRSNREHSGFRIGT
jgi:hypothetical protein